jgi:putative ABC transport system ATP-binding protein
VSALVRAENVRRRYRTGLEVVKVLDRVSLAVHPGELVLLMGPSGSGKTTLLSILAGLLRPDAGEVWLRDQRIDPLSEAEVTDVRRRSIGFVFQGFHLFEALTARDNVAEVLVLKGMRIREARPRAVELLDEVGLAHKATSLPRHLSSGQKQRVALARAMAGDPPILFGDEPTAALDTNTAVEVMRLMRARVRGGRCALVVTHDLRLERFADRVLQLVDGRIEEERA